MSDLIPPDPTQRDHSPAVYQNEHGEIIYRASAIGYCTKMLAALRQEYESKPVPDKIREKMDESSALEDEAIDKFVAEHHNIITEVDRQVPPIKLRVTDGVFIRGKPDTLLRTTDGRTGILEIKNLGDSLYKSNSVSLQPKYLAQGTVYMVGYDFIAFVLRNKETGAMYYKWFDTTPMDFGKLYRKVLHIESLAESLELPESCDSRDYPCPVFYLHESDKFEDWEDMSLQQDFEELARAYDRARAMEKEGKEAKKALQKELREFRARHLDLVEKDGTLETSRARFKKSTFDVEDIEETALEWFLAEHKKTLSEFKQKRKVEQWRLTWRG